MSVLLDNALKVSLILIAVFSITRCLRRQSAAARHWVLAVGICCAAAAPLLGFVSPSWHLDLSNLPAWSRAARPTSVVSTTTIEMPAMGVGSTPSPPGAGGVLTSLTMSGLVLSIWLAGAGVSLCVLLVGLMRLRWLAAGAVRVDRGRFAASAKEIAGAFGVRRPIVLLQSDHPSLLVTWGLAHPKVMLPAGTTGWSDERVQVVLRHEIAHIRRGDWAVQLMAEVLRSVSWFNPLAWIAGRRLRQESEYACDDAVLDGGVDGATYAGHLLELARTLTAGRRAALPASAMARSSSLEGRIAAMLNTDLNRRSLTRWSRLSTAIALLTLTVWVAGLTAQGGFFTFSGTVLDPTGRVLPKTTVALTNTRSEAKYEVKSDSTGRFEFVGLPSGEYALEAKQNGFAPYKQSVAVAGRNVDRNVELQVGSVQETIGVTNRGGSQLHVLTPEQLLRQEEGRRSHQAAVDACANGNVGPVGGNIVPPTKVTDVRPVYPEHLKDAKVGGTVIMDALIGTDGNVKEVQAVSSSDPDLEASAVEAVRQWLFTPTLLNCTPIEVRMRVSTTFTIQP